MTFFGSPKSFLTRNPFSFLSRKGKKLFPIILFQTFCHMSESGTVNQNFSFLFLTRKNLLFRERKRKFHYVPKRNIHLQNISPLVPEDWVRLIILCLHAITLFVLHYHVLIDTRQKPVSSNGTFD
jgi:hypothetical protein